jgi:predicted SAM-dependent methyltransferase
MTDTRRDNRRLSGPIRALANTAAGWKLRLQTKQRPLRIIIGSASTSQKGWIATNMAQLNLLKLDTWRRYFKEGSISALLAEHVWEHLTESDAVIAAQNCYRFLARGGYLRVAVPDGFHPSKSYIESVKPGGSGPGADDHKIMYNYRTVERAFLAAGFEVRLLEWFDEQGEFHFNDWDVEAGMIVRSRRFDPRNHDGSLSYTSIILDALKR